jgi:hypothetical protein
MFDARRLSPQGFESSKQWHALSLSNSFSCPSGQWTEVAHTAGISRFRKHAADASPSASSLNYFAALFLLFRSIFLRSVQRSRQSASATDASERIGFVRALGAFV